MSSSYLTSTRSDPALALGYYPSTGGRFHRAELWDVSNTFLSGGLVSTVGDVLSWDRVLTTGLLLNVASLKTMFSPPSLPNCVTSIYAMGWFVGSNVTWHNGKVSGFHAINAFFSDGYAVVARGNEYEEDSTIDRWQPEKLVIAIHQLLNPALPASLAPLAPAPPVVD